MFAIKLVLDDDAWRAFGYRERPRLGRVVRKFLGAVGRGGQERQTLLIQELWLAGAGSVARWAATREPFPLRHRFLARVLEFCLDGKDEALWPALQWPSRDAAVVSLLESGSDYAGRGREDHADVLFGRLQYRLGRTPPPEWVVGSAWLFGSPAGALTYCAAGLEQAGVADNCEDDIRLRDGRLLDLAATIVRRRAG